MKEPVNTLTHFIPLLIGIVTLIYFMTESIGQTEKFITLTIFGTSVILLYGASSAYHWIKTTPKKELILRKMDHIAIFLLIAGSYTPVLYFGLEGAWKNAMITVVWTLAAVGISLKFWFMNAPRWISTVFYITLGWVAVVPFAKLMDFYPNEAIGLLLIGGVFYTIGGIIYATKIFNFYPNKFGFHEIFHLFIVLGTLSHYIMMYVYILR